MITHFLDAFCRRGRIPLISMHHEQAAAFAVDGVGKYMGKPAVAMATSGPGATNLLTGVATCYFDSSPGIFVTGQVNRHERKGGRPIRQLGFQETDIVAMARPVTKAAWRIETVEELPCRLREAFLLAVAGRPGPVLLDVPMDVQRMTLSAQDALGMSSSPAPSGTIDPAALKDLFAALGAAERPLILAGGGVRCAQAARELRTLAHALSVPVVYSLHAVDVLPSADPLRVGMIGSYGNRWANLALARSDLLLVLGSRLDIRQTGSEARAITDGRRVFHVDCEPGEINNRVTGCYGVVADLRTFFAEAQRSAEGLRLPGRAGWLKEIADLRAAWPDTSELAGACGINPNVFMHRLSYVSRGAAGYVVDVGQHQMWAAQSIDLAHGQRFLTSGGMGSMGYALPAAIGVACIVRPQPVVVISGDGGLQCNIQELQTVAFHGLPVKIVVLNNGCHGMVRQFQESYFECRYQSTMWGYSAPDFARVASAYDIPGRTVAEEAELDEALTWLWNEPEKPALLQVMVDSLTNVYPKIAFGRPFAEMEPEAKPVEMEGT
jgi:acetolactate synthase-1/2/3 large subunit